MITDILNGAILFFTITIGTLFLVFHFGGDNAQPTTELFVDYSNCKNLVERPPQKTVWGDVGQGYDCLD